MDPRKLPSLRERRGDLCSELQNLSDWKRPFGQAVGERLPGDQFHHQVARFVFAADVVERADVRVVQLRDRAGFALETLPQVGTRGEMCRQDLDGDVALEPAVPGAVHLTHATRPNPSDDLIRPE